MSYSAEQARGTKGVTYYVADTDVIVKSVTMSGEMFENVVRANTLALIDEHKGEIEFSNGFFGNFAEFDKPIYDETGVDAYEGSKISNINEIRKSLVQITEERYNDMLSELIAQEQFGDDNIDYERQETMSYYNKEGKTDSHVKMSLTPKSDSTDNSKQNESEMRYYLTNRDVRLNYFTDTNGQRTLGSEVFPKHTVIAVDEANGRADYFDGDDLYAYMPRKSLNGRSDFINLCDVKAMSYEISKEQYDMLYDLERRSYDGDYDCYAKQAEYDYRIGQNEYYGADSKRAFSEEELREAEDELREAEEVRQSVEKEHANALETVLGGLGITNVRLKGMSAEKIDLVDNGKQNESEMRYYLTNRDVRLNYFGSDNGHRMPSSVTLPKHTVVAVDEANKETDYVGYDSLRAWMNDEPDFVNLCDVKAMSYEISKEQYDTLYDLETRSYDSVHDYHMRQNEYYENESNENKDVCFERLCEADTARHSVAKEHANTLETVLDGLGKTNVRLTDTFAGKIEKYGVDIDFTKINSLDVEIASDVYVGGMDENGHEAKDNFRQEKNVISFFMGPENNDLYVYDEHHGFDDPIPTRRALERISDYLDEAARDNNVSLYVKQNDGKTKSIAPILADKQTSKPVSRKMAMLTGLANESKDSIEITNDYSFG